MRSLRIPLLATLTVLLAAQAPAQDAATEPALRLAALFSDHVVLQREADVPVWGWAEPGTEVKLHGDWLGAIPVFATAGEDGRFQAPVKTGLAGGPFRLTVSGGGHELVVQDLMLGEVWLCSGQSNMEWPLKAAAVGSATLEASSDAPPNLDRPRMRVFRVPHKVSIVPQKDVVGSWTVCTPQSAPDFSAVAFHFAAVIQDELDVPIGLVQSAWGGTTAQAWMPEDTIQQFPGQFGALQRLKQLRIDPEATVKNDEEAEQIWWIDFEIADPGNRAAWTSPATADQGWPTMEVPAAWETSQHRRLHDYDGVGWFRHTVEIPDSWASRELTVELGPIDDMDWTWFQGVSIGSHVGPGHHDTPRVYTVPASLVQTGPSTLAVRVYDTGGAGGFTGSAEQMRIYPTDAEAEAISLAGTWKVREGMSLGALPTRVQKGQPNQHAPSVLWNGMMAPLVPMKMRGALWYQGESNRMRSDEYKFMIYMLVRDWRTAFGDEFSFYSVQIAPFAYGGDRGEAAKLREAQTWLLGLPKTGIAVTMDLGNPGDIHPRNKHEVGRRLALWAMAKDYGREQLPHASPTFQSFMVEDGGLMLYFRDATGGLLAPNGLTLFELAADDGVWYPATAEISSDAKGIYVKSESVPKPHYVRYAWGAADQAELFSGVGLPAPSFRSHP